MQVEYAHVLCSRGEPLTWELGNVGSGTSLGVGGAGVRPKAWSEVYSVQVTLMCTQIYAPKTSVHQVR